MIIFANQHRNKLRAHLHTVEITALRELVNLTERLGHLRDLPASALKLRAEAAHQVQHADHPTQEVAGHLHTEGREDGESFVSHTEEKVTIRLVHYSSAL